MLRAISTSPDTRAARANGGYLGGDSLDRTTRSSGSGSTCADVRAAAYDKANIPTAEKMKDCRAFMQEILHSPVTVANHVCAHRTEVKTGSGVISSTVALASAAVASSLTLAFASQECHTPSRPLPWRQLLRRDFLR